MALDLARGGGFEVTVADRDRERLDILAGRGPVGVREIDLADPDAVQRLAEDFELVVGAVPGSLGFRTLEAVIRAGVPVVDIAFFPEDPFDLDALARERGVTAVVDCGVFPGMGSALIGRAARLLDRVDRVVTYVGGLPEVRHGPWEYKAVFSPADVIEEYVRPARFVENGIPVTRPALSEIELIDVPGVGTLEAFNTDGLRTLLRTIDAPDMREKTLRYPGHAARVALLRDAGFFATDPVRVGGVEVRPRDVTAALLFPAWKLEPGEGDLTVLRILVEGVKDDRRLRYAYDLLDRYDPDLGVTSMARTTGYTATMTARLIAGGRYSRPGISPPEYLGDVPGCVPFLLEGLAKRGVEYRETIDLLP